ncbi:MAG: DUF2169 domain-containing protein [Pirellulaceae bacterium]
MEVVNTSAMRFAPLVSLESPDRYVMTLIIKGTFDLVYGGAIELAGLQTLPTSDQRFDESEDCSLRYEADFAPFKPNADLMLIGSCHTPRGIPLRTCEVSYRVGKWMKSLNVHGNRYWTSEHGVIPKITEAEPFVEMPLRYEFSFGGAGNRLNPLGKGSVKEKSKGDVERLPLPNIEDTKNPIKAFLDRPAPAGFGPLDRAWQQRQSKIGTYDSRWKNERWPCLPTDFDASFYNAAPSDAQLPGYLCGDEQLEFINLHPVHSTYQSQLPGLRVRCFVNEVPDDGSQEPVFREVPVNLDTLFVDMGREDVYLLWRGKTEIRSDDYREIKHVFIHTEPLDQTEASVEECHQIFLGELASGGAAASAAGFPLPNVDEMIGKIEARVADLVASGLSAQIINGQLDPRLNAIFPDLAGKSLDEMDTALDVFAVAALAGTKAIADKKEEDAREELAKSGIDLNEHKSAAQRAAKARQAEFITEVGLESDLQELDAEVKKSSVELYMLGIDLGPAANIVDSMSNGLAGLGLNGLPGVAFTEEAPLTRENVPVKVKNGDSFDGILLRGIDLSGLDLQNADFGGAIFVDCSLENADLRGANLSDAVLTQANLRNANLTGSQCQNANLARADLTQANFTSSILTNAILEQTVAVNAVFDQASATGTKFVGSDLTGASLLQAELTAVDLSSCILSKAIFRQSLMQRCDLAAASGKHVDFTAADLTQARASSNCTLTQSNFQQAQGKEANWSDADLTGSDFSYSFMPGAFFVRALLEKTNMQAAGLRQARFSKANMQGANLVECDLYQADFEAADLSFANLNGANAFEANFFRVTRNLTTTVGTNLKHTLLA